MFRKKSVLKRNKGFTLIELLIVLSVIGILIGIALPRFRGMQDEGNIAKSKGEIRTLQLAIESFSVHNANATPATLADLTTAVPTIVNVIPDDPFAAAGTDYGYARGGVSNRSYAVFSVGPGANGSVSINAAGVLTETNGASCMYVSNIQSDTTP